MENPTELQKLSIQIKNFCEDRDWNQFHTPKDLAIGISTEAAELLELFRFKSDEEVSGLFNEPAFRVKVEQELADIFFFLLRFAERSNVDLLAACDSKMKLNAEKYSIEKSKGSNKKYSEL